MGDKPHLNLSNFDEVFMSDVVNFNPQEIEHAVHAISAVTHAVPGLYQALYETIGLFWIDPIKRKRREENLKAELHMAEETIKGQKRLEDISATLAKEVLEPAMEEDREELQKLWAGLLARILVEKNNGIRKEIIELIKKLNPIDVLVIEQFAAHNYGERSALLNSLFVYKNSHKKYGDSLSYDETDFMISFDFLYKNNIITYPTLLHNSGLTFFKNNNFGFSELGKKIVEITSPPKSE